MSRKLLSLGALAAAFTLVLGATEVQARHCRSQSSSPSCCQSGNHSRSIFSIFTRCNYSTQRQVYYTSRQPVNNGCRPKVQQRCRSTRYIRQKARCNPQPACRVVQTACQNVQTSRATSTIQTNSPAPNPPLDNASPPAPGRSSEPATFPAPAPSPAQDSAPAPKL